MTLLVVGHQPPHRARRRCSTGSPSSTAPPSCCRSTSSPRPHVAESLVLSTCNRVEVYAEVSKFHGGVVDVTETLAKATGVAATSSPRTSTCATRTARSSTCSRSPPGSTPWSSASSRSSARCAARCAPAQDAATAGRSLNDLAQAALRVGKRAHHDTGIDRAGASVVSVALHLAADALGGSLGGRRALVVGAGAMSGLAAATPARARASARSSSPTARSSAAQRLAEQVGGRAVALRARSPTLLADVDIVVSCTGSTGLVLTADARRGRPRAAAPRRSSSSTSPCRTTSTEPSRRCPGVTPHRPRRPRPTCPRRSAPEHDVELARGDRRRRGRARTSPRSPRSASSRSSSRCAARADQVVEAELAPPAHAAARPRRRRARRGRARAAPRRRRRCCTRPTVRMKELAADPDGARYATALHRALRPRPRGDRGRRAPPTQPTTCVRHATPDAGIDDLLGGRHDAPCGSPPARSLLARTQSGLVADALRERLRPRRSSSSR